MSQKNNSGEKKPPQFAKFLISICTHKKYRDDILGDLHEEFLKKSSVSIAAANKWYWHQVWHSIAPLLGQRMNLTGLSGFLWVVFLYALTLMILIYWDKWIAINAVQSLALQENPPNGTLLRILYFVLFTIGGVFAAFVSAWVNSNRGVSIKENVVYCLMPVFLSITVVVFYQALSRGEFQLFVFLYILMRTLILGCALAIGVLLYRFLQKTS